MSDPATSIHRQAVVVDGHCDSAWMRTWPRHEGKTADLYTRDESYQCDGLWEHMGYIDADACK